ncbi:MAG: hypothetical protein MJA28_15135 [Gammaproteobacteria bacterium]|nr:hypothetical protein [Gammaproteobacteria bacterium]
MADTTLYLGISLTPKDCEAVIIDNDQNQQATASVALPHSPLTGKDAPTAWIKAVEAICQVILPQVDRRKIGHLSIVSPTDVLLLSDAFGNPVSSVLGHDYRCSYPLYARISPAIPAQSGAGGDSSSLFKLLELLDASDGQSVRPMHQSEWLTAKLSGQNGICNEHQATRLGYDPVKQRWPRWLDKLTQGQAVLPQVVIPGTPMGTLTPAFAQKLSLPVHVQIVAGTTSETAEFLSTGLHDTPRAITRFNPFLTLQNMASMPVFSSEHGVYSHRLGSRWLVHATSHTGMTAVYHYLPEADVNARLDQVKANPLLNLDLYPLVEAGEQFPIRNPRMRAVVNPRPDDNTIFLQALLEALADAEHDGYWLLQRLGSRPPEQVYTFESGPDQGAWLKIREQKMKTELCALETKPNAALGAALVASGHM